MRKLTKRGLVVVTTAILALGLGAPTSQAAEKPDDGGIVTPMIVGGSTATALTGEVSIQIGGGHRCGGSLITRQWVLTAAHCAPILVPGETQVRVGSLDWTAGGELVGVQKVVYNPIFTGETPKGDHALVKLDRRVRARTVPMAFSTGGQGTPTRITGWGLTCKDPARPECAVLPSRLQQLDTVVVAPKRCDLGTLPNGVPVFDPATEVCIASADGQARMACNGDSGGPLLRKIFGVWFLVGTTSGDGDDLEPHPNDCNTGPDGVTPGVGMWERTAPSFLWIFETLLGADPSAAQEFAHTTRH